MPGVDIHFVLGTARDAVQAIRSHTVELGVVGAFAPAPEVEAEPLIEDEIVIVGPPGLARRRRSRDGIEELTWITRGEGSGTSAIGDSILGSLGIIPRRRLVLPSWEAIKLAVRAGCGIAALSRFAVAEELAAGALVLLPALPSKVLRSFSIIRTRDAALTPAAQDFLRLLREHCAKRRPRHRGTRAADRQRGCHTR